MSKLQGLCCLLLAQHSVAQQLSRPFALGESVVGPAGGEQFSPAVAWTGSEYFVVWSDLRDGRSSDLWFATCDSQGLPLAPSLPLVRASGQQGSPSVAAGGAAVLVAWLDDRSCAHEVMAQRFTLAGQPAGPLLQLSTGACTSDRPSLAWDARSSQWLVAWGSHGAGSEVHGALVAVDGSLASGEFVIASAPNSARSPSVSSPLLGTTSFQVVWSDDRLAAGVYNLYAVTVSSSGTVAAATRFAPSATSQLAPSNAPLVGTDLLVVWLEGSAVLGQRVTDLGLPVGPQLLVTGTSSDVTSTSGPGGQVLVATTDSRNPRGPGVFLRTVDDQGTVSAEFPAAPYIGDFSRDQPRLAAGGNDALLVVHGPWDYISGSNVLGRRVTVSGGLTADAGRTLISTAAGTTQRQARAGWDGTNYLVGWRDDALGSGAQGQLLESRTGRCLVDGGLPISGGLVGWDTTISVAGTPSWGFWVSWGGNSNIEQVYGRPVSPQGALGPWLLLSDSSIYIRAQATTWLVDGWTTAFVSGGMLRLRRTSPLLATVQPETSLISTGTAPRQIDVAALDAVMLSVFLAIDAGVDVWGARFDADAGLLDPQGFAISNQPGDEADPAVAAGANLFLVAWSQGGAVRAARINKQGVVLDVPPLSVGAPGLGGAPAVGWNGSSFVVAWQRDADVLGARVSEAGLLLDATPFLVSSGVEIGRAPRVTGGPVGETLLTWESFSDQLGNVRVFGRFLHESEDGGLLVADAGEGDAGAEARDSGVGPLDAGLSPPVRVPLHYSVGCGCAADPSAAPAIWSLVLLSLVRGSRSGGQLRRKRT